MSNQVFHEGSILFVKGTDRDVVIGPDMDFDEACNFMLKMSKEYPGVSPVVRKTLRKVVRRQTGTGWPKS